MLSSTTLRVEEKILRKIGQMAAKLHLDRGTFLRQLVMRGYEDAILDEKIEEYKKSKISIGELAQATGRSVWEINGILKSRKVESNIDMDDIENASILE